MRLLRRALAANLGWPNRILLSVGYLVVAVQDDTWFAVAMAVVWMVTAQLALLDAYNRGWLDRGRWHEEATGRRVVALEDLLDLCDKHDVPVQEIADLVWRGDK